MSTIVSSLARQTKSIGGQHAGTEERVLAPLAANPSVRISALAGKPPTPEMLVDVPRLLTAYFANVPDPSLLEQRVAFGESGHRGRALDRTFNEAHVLSISQAICDFRRQQGIDGPLFLGIDTHALSVPAAAGAIEVLAANGVQLMLAAGDEYTPTPVISHAILAYNRGRIAGMADGIVITPSHSPPDNGGFKYNPPTGAPARPQVNDWIQVRANTLLFEKLRGVRRMALARALSAATTHRHDFISAYVTDLANVLDMGTIRGSGLNLGVDPLGGAGVHYWPRISEYHGLNLTVVNEAVDPTFKFMTVDWDGQIRMDPTSSYAMRRLIDLKDSFDICFACDTDHDRHGIVTRSAGLMPPNHYLAVALFYLFQQRSSWSAVTGPNASAARLGRKLYQLPAGFKWFLPGVLRRDGSVWTTDKDGFVPALLSAEITARMGRDPAEIYRELMRDFAEPVYDPVPAAAAPERKEVLAQFTPQQVQDILNIYGQRLSGNGQLRRIVSRAQVIIDAALAAHHT